MALRTTLWTPDTHDCQIELEWDDSVPPESRTHTVKRVLKRDPGHAAKPDAELFSAVLEENQRRNKTLGWLLDNVASVAEDATDEDGNTFRRLKRGVSVSHSFNAATREMEVTITPPLGAVAKNLIQTFVDNRLGAGKVKFL